MKINIINHSLVLLAESASEILQVAEVKRQAKEQTLQLKSLADGQGLEVSLQRRLLTDEQAKMLLGMLEQ